MTGFVFGPRAQFFDNNGVPLSGGQMWVYVANTTTTTVSYNTWGDAISSSNAQTNPIPLNSRGECVIIINTAVRLVLEGSDIDPVTGHGTVIWDCPEFHIAAAS